MSESLHEIDSDTGEKNYTPDVAQLVINYDPIVEPETQLPMTIDLYGVGVIPNSTFNSWTNITVTSGEEKTNISFSWEDFTPADESIEIDGYNVYFSDDELYLKQIFYLQNI